MTAAGRKLPLAGLNIRLQLVRFRSKAGFEQPLLSQAQLG